MYTKDACNNVLTGSSDCDLQEILRIKSRLGAWYFI